MFNILSADFEDYLLKLTINHYMGAKTLLKMKVITILA